VKNQKCMAMMYDAEGSPQAELCTANNVHLSCESKKPVNILVCFVTLTEMKKLISIYSQSQIARQIAVLLSAKIR
jgi:hypothetical protein